MHHPCDSEQEKTKIKVLPPGNFPKVVNHGTKSAHRRTFGLAMVAWIDSAALHALAE